MNELVLEKQCIKPDKWNTAPKNIKEQADKLSAEGVPTAIGFNKELGWFIIQTAGQGPILVMSSKREQKK